MSRDADTSVLAALHARHFGEVPAAVTPLKGDASDRRIFRLASVGATSIGILGPNIPENRAFTGFARAFRAAGLPVPEIFAIADGHGAYLEEDLGDVTLALWQEALGVERRAELLEMYTTVLGELVRFQVDAADVVDYGLCYQTAEFGEEAMAFDVAYFRTHVLERLMRGEWDRASFDRETRALVGLLQRAPRETFLYRDFQSRNVMIRDGA
ncbi:MAG: phosphotransferase, partial [Bacteroidetes bacterium]|nr:phosphotransferase [Bacteroidota bacterium]